MSTAARLYTPEILALAVSLAEVPYDQTLPLEGEARSATCGSALALSLGVDREGRIAQLGARAQACAIGQASAALFARHAIGLSQAELMASRTAVAAWLAGPGVMPDWPDLALLAAARDFPARHGAILLAWDAALDALSSA